MRLRYSKAMGIALWTGLALIAGTIGASASSVSLSDGTFASITTHKYGATTPPTSVCPNCGDPGAALQATYVWGSNPGTGGAGVGFLDNGLSYDPATQGAIISFSASVDKQITATNGLPTSSPFRPLLEQGGNFYIATLDALAPNGTFQFQSGSGLTASNFSQICLVACGAGDFDNTGNLGPDTAVALNLINGGSITFGLLTTSSPMANDTITPVFDNLDFNLATTPLPSTWSMLIVGYAGLGFFAYRGSKKGSAAIAAA
jgi:hypothetical protein